MAKKLYYASTGCGACIRVAKDEDDAYKKILREVGTRAGVEDVREATEQDIAWVRGMGGYVPQVPNVKLAAVKTLGERLVEIRGRYLANGGKVFTLEEINDEVHKNRGG